MAAFTDEMRIDSPCALVFDPFADARNELQWNDGVSRVELLTDEPIGKGAQFIVEDRRGEHEVAITVFGAARASGIRRERQADGH